MLHRGRGETAPHSVPTGTRITNPNPEMVKKRVHWPVCLGEREAGTWRKVPTVCMCTLWGREWRPELVIITGLSI